MSFNQGSTSFFGLILLFATHANAQAPAFEVSDIPKEPPIEGQLGEPGAPSLTQQQEHLARSMLEKGICNASYYGEEFCKKHQQKSFRVTDEFGSKSQKPVKSSQE
ncbi:MAG: hypothetical protein V4655_03455 [Bdellovibrionota bacterium]|nr:MAG: hypothetical protein EOP09_15805 [Pseudomonadota bacterium]